jgi:hypothetical protein
VPEPLQRTLQMFFQEKPGMIGAYRNAHRLQIVLYG